MAKQNREIVKNAIMAAVGQCADCGYKFDELCQKVRNEVHVNRESIEKQIEKLLNEGVLVKNEKNRIVRNPAFEPKQGVIQVTASGSVFCVMGEGQEDFYIDFCNLNGAIEGDVVKVLPIASKRTINKRTPAKVVEIVKQAKKTVVGVFVKEKGFSYISCEGARTLMSQLLVRENAVNAKPGDTVVVEVVERPMRGGLASCRITESLGKNASASVKDLTPEQLRTKELIVMREHEVFEEWPDNVKDAVKSLPAGVDEKDMEGRHDFSNEKDDFGNDVLCITIDGEDAKDFDDAVGIAKTKEGGYRLYVHIADVSHYVKEGGALDQEAITRATSIYFPTGVLPMLPEALSNDLCSLNEKTKKLTMSCVIDYDENGKEISAKIMPSVIVSARRCTYTEVFGVLKGEQEYLDKLDFLVPSINLMQELAQKLTARTKAREALSIDSSENKYLVPESYDSVSASKYDYTDANRIIEEFMIAANIEVARYMLENDIPGVYRVHEEPDKEKYIKIKAYIKSLGYPLPDDISDEPTYENINTLLEVEKDDEQTREIISNIVLRSLKKAVYKEDCLGHFGLALEEYCHFTSPIRRYPDLFVHRQLHEFFDHKLNTEKARNRAQEKAFEAADQSTAREQVATDCERKIDDFWMCVSLKDKIGETFDAQVCGGTERGVFVRFGGIYEGYIPFNDLEVQTLRGQENGGKDAFYQPWYPYSIKDKFKIKITDIDLDGTRIICEQVRELTQFRDVEPQKKQKTPNYIAIKNK